MTDISDFKIEKIIKEIKGIVLETREDNPNLAYFAILYLYVTIQISKEIFRGSTFENNKRIERLDVIFALRYIEAYKKWKKGEEISSSWKIAFEFSKEKNTMIMQHLLLGMNAHINLDLGIATVEAISVEDNGLKPACIYRNFNSIIKDFTIINEVLNKMTNTVEKSLASHSYFFRLIRKYGRNKEAILADFSVKYARTGAWYFASFYCRNKTKDEINKRDQDIYKLAKGITEPKSKLIRFLLTIGAISETVTAKDFVSTLIKELDDFIEVEFDAI